MASRRLHTLVLSGPTALPYRHAASLVRRRALTVPFRRPTSTASAAGSPPRPPFLWRAFSFTARAAFFTTLGVIMAVGPAARELNGILHPPSDKDTLTMFVPPTPEVGEIEAHITNHRLAAAMRAKPTFTESRPHEKIPTTYRSHNLTAGTLMGPGRVTVPPLAWSEEGGRSYVQISHAGPDLCGHPGILHGGYLATLLDEGLVRCCVAALPHRIGMTARLAVDYRAPAPADSYLVLRAETTKVEGRKAWVRGRVETLVPEGEKPVVVAEAEALVISPRQAAMMAKIIP